MRYSCSLSLLHRDFSLFSYTFVIRTMIERRIKADKDSEAFALTWINDLQIDVIYWARNLCEIKFVLM